MSPSKKPPAFDPPEPDLFSRAGVDEDGHAEGYAAWRADVQRHREAVEKRFGIPLGHRVRVQLMDELKPLEGLLCVVEEREGSRAKGLRLRVGDRTFVFNEIESVVAVG